MRILVVEDDAATGKSVELMLISAGFNTYLTDLGEEAVDLAKLYDYDVVLLNLDLPDMAGQEVLRRLRAAKILTPVIILDDDSRIETQVALLAGGADDYITKPFHRDNLVARLQAVVRRSQGRATPTMSCLSVTVEPTGKNVTVQGERVHLSGKEYEVLELLISRKDSTFTKEAILNHLYGGMDEPELKIVDVFICKVRNRLREAGAEDIIETVWGRGYRASETLDQSVARQHMLNRRADGRTHRINVLKALIDAGQQVTALYAAQAVGITVCAFHSVVARSQGDIAKHHNRRDRTYSITAAGRAAYAALLTERGLTDEVVAAQ